MRAVFKREFGAYFHSLTGYIFLAVYLFFCGILFSSYNLLAQSPSWAYALSDMAIVLALIIPAVAVIKLSETRKSGGEGLLDMLPIKRGEIVLGKYFAILSLFAVGAAISAFFPMILGFFGEVNYRAAYGAFLAFVLFGAALTAFCSFISTVIRRPAVCAAVSYGVLVLLYFANIITVLLPTGSLAAEAIGYVSLFGGFDKFVYGIFDLKAILYYLAATALFLLLSVRAAQPRAGRVKNKKDLTTKAVAASLVLLMLFVSVGMSLLPVSCAEFDMTGQGRYAISSEAKKFLRGVDEEVTLYVLDPDGTNPQLESFLRRYAESGKNVGVKYVKTAEVREILASYGYSADSIPPYSLLICSDKRGELVDFYSMYYYVNEKLGISSMSYSDYNYYYSLFSSSDSYATYLEALIYSSELYFNGDAVITGVIEYVTLDIIPHAYFITGRGEDSVSDGRFVSLLGQMYYYFEALDITKSQSIPEDACCIVINEPESDYTEAEAEMILDYLKSGGRLLLVTGEGNVGMKNLSAITEYYGMTVVEGLVFEKPESEAEEGEEADIHSLTPVLNDSHDIFASFNYSLSIKKANAITVSDELRRSQLVTPIVTTSEKAYVGDESVLAVYNLGVAVEEETEGGTTRLVWVSGADSFNDTSSAQNNLALLVYSLDWLDESYTSSVGKIDGVRFSDAMLNISSGMALGIGVTFALIIPAALIVGGVIVRAKRRRA